jgi:hypothetical protein
VTGNGALAALLARIAASYNGAPFFSAHELREWPKVAVASFKKCGLLVPAPPANNVTCDGCEQQCPMPVKILLDNGRSMAFVACDKDTDIGSVPVRTERLEQWQASGEAVAAFLADVLDINRPLNMATQAKRWDVGRLKSKRVEPVVLATGDALTLELAGHSVPLVEVLSQKGRRLELDRQTLNICVDNPAVGHAGEVDLSARVAQLDADIEENRRRGVRAPVATAMKAAHITRQRLHSMRKALKKRKASTLT